MPQQQSPLNQEHISLEPRHSQVALLTKHHKVTMIAPPLLAQGVSVTATDAFDTDSLGTFAGEVLRQHTPLDCARTKATLAISLTGLTIGIGSEGSFGGGPMPGLLNWDEELLLWLDSRTGQEIVAVAAGPIPLSALSSRDPAAFAAHISRQDPAQGWILRYQGGLVKGLIGYNALQQAWQEAKLLQSDGQLAEEVQLEPDFRAHLCPVRQQYIQQAAQQLAERLAAHCPRCQTPDFWRKQVERGLPCEACHAPTTQVKYYIKSCSACGHTEQEAAATAYASAAHCASCNP
jgi:predicted nucleic-acid-binding Zn-ribbon protein